MGTDDVQVPLNALKKNRKGIWTSKERLNPLKIIK